MSRYARTFLITIAIIIVFAYGFQVTEINLEEPKQEDRQNQLTNVLRALARPDLVEYETERINVEAPILIPCPTTEVALPDLSQAGAGIQLSTDCAEPSSEITVTGSGFMHNDRIFLYFVPYNEDPAQALELPLIRETVIDDRAGNFSQVVELRSGRTAEQPQTVRAVVNRQSGAPRPTQAVYDTIEKIIETIFLALIATSIGTLLSIPISFLAARNLMINVTSLFGSLVTLVALAPLGWWLGSWLFGMVGGWGAGLVGIETTQTAAALFLMPAIIVLSVQAMTRSISEGNSITDRIRRFGIGLLGALVVALILGLVGGIGQHLGLSLEDTLGSFGFLGNFIFVASDALVTFLPFIGALTGMFSLVSLGGTLAENFLQRTETPLIRKAFTVFMAVIAGAVLLGIPAALIVWLYNLTNPSLVIGQAAAVGGLIMGGLALYLDTDQPIGTGMIVYYVTRTILNILRAIEPLIMAIVFVVWVGIGPFAGVLALTLHTIAALGKLYSEQVENIAQGPIEALTATGANRLQTIIYAVIPQIVPPYIAFTIYRWDINVRMSTIIGFAGGGGIGFLLQQNLNLLKYRQASVQMIAIAIVVASLDYISAKIRERIT
jgi:phosphonate ABC transporter permease subunit PhnE